MKWHVRDLLDIRVEPMVATVMRISKGNEGEGVTMIGEVGIGTGVEIEVKTDNIVTGTFLWLYIVSVYDYIL